LGFAEEDSSPRYAWLECSSSAVLLGAPSTGRKIGDYCIFTKVPWGWELGKGGRCRALV